MKVPAHTRRQPFSPAWSYYPVGPGPPLISRTHLPAECSHQQPQLSSPVTPSCILSFRHMLHRNLTRITPHCLHELVPSLLPSVPPKNSPAHPLLPGLRPSQLLAPYIRESGAQDSCTSRSACAQGVPHSRKRSTCPYLHPSCRRRHLRMFYSSSRSCIPQRGDLSFRN